MGNLHLFYFFKHRGTLREVQRYAEEEIIILSESTEQIEASASASENKLMTEAAQLLGCKVYYIPRDFERCGTAENALWHIPNYPQATAGI